MLKLESIPSIEEENFSEKEFSLVSKEGPLSTEQILEKINWKPNFENDWNETHPSKIQEEKLRQEDIQNIQRINELVKEEATDEEFLEKLEEIKKALPSKFKEMQGMQQTPPHWNIDPVDHTFNMLKELHVEHLPKEDQYIARMASIFHDIGKVENPKDQDHPRLSEEIMKEYFDELEMDPLYKERILNHIKWHDALGDLTRTDGRNLLNPFDATTFFPDEKELKVHEAIVHADINSIPGLRKYLPGIEATHELLNNHLKAHKELINIKPERVINLPVEEVLIEDFADETEDLWEQGRYFDEIDIDDEMERRRNSFYQLPPQTKTFIEESLISFSLREQPFLFKALQLTGRENDRTFVTELEEKYETKLESLRVAVELFNMTYNLWELNKEIEIAEDEDEIGPDFKKFVMSKLNEIKKSTLFLSSFQMIGTHAARGSEAFDAIDSSRNVIASYSTPEAPQYEGDGVYVGLIGCFRDWSRDSDPFEMKAPLAYSVPIIVSYNNPKAMANILCEGTYMHDDASAAVIPHGRVEWRQDSYEETIAPWKITLLEEALAEGEKATTTIDDEDKECLVIETDHLPIVWGTLARALRIRRFIPENQLSKGHSEYDRDADKEPMFGEDPEDKYEDLAKTARHIKGVRIEDYL